MSGFTTIDSYESFVDNVISMKKDIVVYTRDVSRFGEWVKLFNPFEGYQVALVDLASDMFTVQETQAEIRFGREQMFIVHNSEKNENDSVPEE
ncbi:hypothetical protein IWW38_004336, partial [Coemansia aciculifera]